MLKKTKLTKREIEERLAGLGDYVKIDFLTRSLNNTDLETRRFVLVKLSEIYESLKMYFESAKSIRSAADINTSDEGRMKDHLRSMELFIKSDNYDEGEISLTKAMACAKESQKQILKRKRIEIYKNQAEEYIKKEKWKKTMTLYERFIRLTEISNEERNKAQSELLKIYDKLGKISEYGSLKRSLEAPARAAQPQVKETKENDFDVDAFIGKQNVKKPKSFY